MTGEWVVVIGDFIVYFVLRWFKEVLMKGKVWG
jgi:hypothetical protein